MCVDGNDDGCGSQSVVAIHSTRNDTSHVLMHGFGYAAGHFALLVITEALSVGGYCAAQMLEPDGLPRNVVLADAAWEAKLPASLLCFSLSKKLPQYGLWYSIVGTGNGMFVHVDSEAFDVFAMMSSVLPSSNCSNLPCVLMDCMGI
jgi:hypothetical protein